MQDHAPQADECQVAEYFQKALYASNLDIPLYSKHNMRDGELSLAEHLFCTFIAQTFEYSQRRVTKHRSTDHVVLFE